MPTRYVYVTGGREVAFDDLADVYKPEDIKAHWAATFPELSAATWETTEKDGVKTVTFAKKVGTKGGEWPDWVRVEERLPDEEVLVLVTILETDRVTVGNHLRPTEETDGGWAILDEDFIENDWGEYTVTHWLPLPPLPARPELEAPAGDGYAVRNFIYSGFAGRCLRGFAQYRATFVEWTSDPGVGWFDCSDGERRLIPTFALPDFDASQYPAQAKTGVMFGQGARS